MAITWLRGGCEEARGWALQRPTRDELDRICQEARASKGKAA